MGGAMMRKDKEVCLEEDDDTRKLDDRRNAKVKRKIGVQKLSKASEARDVVIMKRRRLTTDQQQNIGGKIEEDESEGSESSSICGEYEDGLSDISLDDEYDDRNMSTQSLQAQLVRDEQLSFRVTQTRQMLR